MPLHPVRAAVAAGAAAVALAALDLGAQVTPAPRTGVDWPSFRGVRAAGVADGVPLPAGWDVPGRRNVRWRTSIDGLGHSSPVIWGQRLCITTAISGERDAGLKPGLYGDVEPVNDTTRHTWKLICLDKRTGQVTLDKTVLSAVPRIKRHPKSTHANATLATDGTHLVAMFGSEGLHVFDMEGRELWKKDFGVLDAGWFVDPGAQWAFSSSPILHNGTVVVLADVQQNSFLTALDVRSGRELWRTPRHDVPTFGTPTIHQVGNTTQILVNGWRASAAYDFRTGTPIWTLNGGGDIPVPTPIAGHGLVFFTNAHGPLSPVYAIKETAAGDISLAKGQTTSANIVWHAERQGSYMSTPILYRDLLYVCRWNGVLAAFDAKTGTRVYQERLGDGTTAFTSSAVAGDGKIYFTGEDGDVYVLRAGRTFEVIGRNPLGEVAMATPAISEGVIYFRTAKSVVAVGN